MEGRRINGLLANQTEFLSPIRIILQCKYYLRAASVYTKTDFVFFWYCKTQDTQRYVYIKHEEFQNFVGVEWQETKEKILP